MHLPLQAWLLSRESIYWSEVESKSSGLHTYGPHPSPLTLTPPPTTVTFFITLFWRHPITLMSREGKGREKTLKPSLFILLPPFPPFPPFLHLSLLTVVDSTALTTPSSHLRTRSNSALLSVITRRMAPCSWGSAKLNYGIRWSLYARGGCSISCWSGSQLFFNDMTNTEGRVRQR